MSVRLRQIAARVRGPVVCDIGTDHGRLPAMLLDDPAIYRVIATDISEASLAKCRRLLATHPNRGRAFFAVADGLEGIDTRTVDTVVISGMGGHRIIGILTRALQENKELRRLILSPQKGEEEVRRFLHEKSFAIVCDGMVEEAGKFYTVITAEPGQERYGSEKDYRYGKLALAAKDPVLARFLRAELAVQEQVLASGLSEASRTAVLQRIDELKEVLNALQDSRYPEHTE